MNYNFKYLFAFLAIYSLQACKKDDHNHSDHDAITKVVIQLTSGSDTTKLTFVDTDGDGGNAPVITGGTLKMNRSYEAYIHLYTIENSIEESITENIKSEGTEHQFFFNPSFTSISTGYIDVDANNKPIGLRSIWNTNTAANGSIRVTLRHLPNKDAAGVAAGNIANAGGDTDIEIDFPLAVQ